MSTTLPSPELQLDEATHTYMLGGRRLPSVTEILVGAGIIDTQWFDETSRWRGSAVHLACQFDDEGELDEERLDPQLAGYLAAYRKFKRETGFVPQVIEEPVFHPAMGYAGTPDRIGQIGEVSCLIDLKTGQQNKATLYQLTGYAACLPSPMLYLRAEVRLKANGSYSITVFDRSNYRRDFARWQSILDVFYLRKELKLI